MERGTKFWEDELKQGYSEGEVSRTGFKKMLGA